MRNIYMANNRLSDIPDFAVAVGSPARVIKYRFSAKQIDLIKQSMWWNSEIDHAKKVTEELSEKLVRFSNDYIL